MAGTPLNGRLQKEIQALGSWFHNIHLPDGTQTAPHHFLGDFPSYKWEKVRKYVPHKMEGWSVLDIGCNAGFYSIQLALRGAKVDAIEVDRRYMRQAKWASKQFGVRQRIRFYQKSVYELISSRRKYDLVLFMGVFYHLRYPLFALDAVARNVGKHLIFQTLTMPDLTPTKTAKNYPISRTDVLNRRGWPKMSFVERCFAGDPTNWWVPNDACVRAMLRSAGMKVVQSPGHEIYFCKPDRNNPSAQLTRFCPEYRQTIRLFKQK